MRTPSILAASVIVIGCAITAFAQAQNAPAFEKKNYTYSEWTKGRFSEAVTVTGPGKTIFLAGVGAEDENSAAGTILHPGDFMRRLHALRPDTTRVMPLLSRPCNPVNYSAGTGARCKQQERNRLPVKGEIYRDPSSSI